MASGLKGKLTVHFHKAIDLKDVQTFGKQDPYCQIYVGQEQYKTRVANDAGKNPVWEQAFLFNLTGVEDAIHIKINDRESLIDRPIGRVDIPLQELIIKASKGPAWFQVHDVNNFQIKAGQISISAEFTGTGLVSSNTAAPPSAPMTSVPAPVPTVQQRPVQQAPVQQYQAPPQQYQPPPQTVYQQPHSQPVYHQPSPQPIFQQPQPQPVYHAQQQPLYQPPPAYAPQPVQPVIYQPPPQQYAPQPVVYQQPVMYQQPVQPVVYAPQPVMQPPIMQTYIPPVNPYGYPGAR